MSPRAFLSFLLAIFGCNSTLPGNPTPLLGQFGGVGAEFRGYQDKLIVRIGCYRTQFDGAVTLSADGSFSAEGRVSSTNVGSLVGLKARISGQYKAGNVLLIHALRDVHGVWAKPDTFDLRAGANASYPEGIYCLN